MKINRIKLEFQMAKKIMSKNDLSRLSEVSLPTIDDKRDKRPDTIGRLAKALGCNVEDLI